MPLFQNAVSRKYLNAIDKQTLTEQWNIFTAHFHNPQIQENIRNSNEEQYQEGFLRDLFVTILGYTLNPSTNFNLTTEYKNIKDSKKADGAIIINDKVVAVIELKGTNTTDISKIEAQAFGYKNNQPDCVYVITSNFEKLRFYIDNAIEHIEFNLFTLTETEFELLYLCLAYPNIAKNIPQKIKAESLSQEDTITKQLYSDYSVFKRALFQNLVQLNPQYEPLELFKKSQKLLDRFLFLFFAEDRQLLPPNSVRLIVDDWADLKERDAYIPLYNRFKKYFEYLNTGYKGKRYDVFAYNGGLFFPDDILDNVQIDDEVLEKHTVKLSDYDFISEVDVNILGHIFEHSLNELDEMKSELEGQAIDKSKTKRKKDGVFYTPKYITKYIVENTVGKLCKEKKDELQIIEEEYAATAATRGHVPLKKVLYEKLTTYRNWLLQITICDPACGSGAFLNQALNFLIEEHRYIDELQAKLFGDAMVLSDVDMSILENNLYGVDINEESVEIAKLSLWLRTAKPNRKLNVLSNNIKCGNSLIDDPAVAGDKAFHWQSEFPQVFEEKNKRAWHVTSATHDSRTSQRMIDHKVRLLRDKGQNPFAAPILLELEDELMITRTVARIVKEDKLNVMAFNICKDHFHLILVCEEGELEKIVGKIKGVTSREYNISKEITQAHSDPPIIFGISGESDKGTCPLVITGGSECECGHIPLSNSESISKVSTKKKPYNSLWTQKFGCKEIRSDEQLWTTVDYIKQNRAKHNLPRQTDEFYVLLQNMCSTFEYAFRPEYKGGFDVVIGNPPYVNIANIQNKNEREFYQLFYETVKNKSDLYSIFTEKAYHILKQNGFFSFIFSNSWLGTDSFSKFREFLIEKTKIIELVKLPSGVFQDAIVTTIILTFRKIPINNNLIILKEYKNDQFEKYSYTLDYSRIKSTNTLTFSFEPEIKFNIPTKKLSEIAKFSLGIKTSDDKRFILSEKIDNDCYPMLRGRDISRYYYNNPKEWIWYKPKLMMEKVGAGPRNLDCFKDNKIYIQDISQNIVALFCDKFILSNDTLSLIYELNNNYNFKTILCILNSKLINKWFKTSFQAGLHIKINQLQQIPIPIISISDQQPLIHKADLMLSLNKELQETSQKFQRSIQRKFSLEDLPNKLKDWYELSYSEFIKELAKKKIKLNLSEEAEWEDYFNAERQNAQAFKQQIDETDREIDRMVYELYGLSEEEITIVETSNK